MKYSAFLVYLSLFITPLANADDFRVRTVIKSSHQSILSSELAGQVTELPLHAGQKFNKNDILIGIDCRLYQSQLDKIEAQLSAATSKLKNDRELEKLHSIGQLDIALDEANFKQAKAEVKMAKLNVTRCNIRAPWSGSVIAVNTRQFEYVSAQQPVIEILGDHSLYAEAIIPVAWIKLIKKDMNVNLHSPDLDITETATIESVNPAIDPVSQTILVRIKLPPNTQMLVGISTEADFAPFIDVQK